MRTRTDRRAKWSLEKLTRAYMKACDACRRDPEHEGKDEFAETLREDMRARGIRVAALEGRSDPLAEMMDRKRSGILWYLFDWDSNTLFFKYLGKREAR